MRTSVVLAVGLLLGACDGDDPTVTSNALNVTASGSAVLTLAGIEGGAPLAVGVSLALAPDEPIVVALAADSLVALDRATLTFTAANYDQPQPVVITPVDDGDVVDGAGEIVLTAPNIDSLAIPIAIADDDRVAIVGLPAGVLIMEGASTTFGIALGADPGGAVTITLASSDATNATVQPSALTFAGDWAVAQTVTVTAVTDADALDEEVAIDLGGLHAVAATVPVAVLDVDRQNFLIAPTALALTEGGTSGTFTVRLTQPPTGPLAIAVAPASSAIATVAPTTLTFTAADYATPQTVTVSPRADLDGAADTSTVHLTSSGLRDRVVALVVAEDATADLPAVGGDFLMTIRPAAVEGTVRYRVTYTADPITATLAYSATALRADDGQPVGDPIVASGLALAEDASFTGGFDGVLPAEANPISGTALVVDAAKLGRIVDADLLCGTLTGAAGPLPLDGTTWGAVRITGSTLPAPVDACPQ